MAKLKWAPVPDMVGWNRLKSLRTDRGLTQPQVAVGAGVSITQIYNLELGYENRTTARTKAKIARFFGVDIGDIFPCEWIGNQPAEKYLQKIKKGAGQPVIK